MSEDILMLKYWKRIFKKLPIVIYTTIIIAVIAFVISCFLPKSYRAKTTIMPKESQQGFGMASFMKMMPSYDILPSISGKTNVSEYLINILKSRTIAKKVIKAVNLNDKFKGLSEEKIVDLLQLMTNIRDSKNGLIEVIADSEDPKLSADIANSYIEELKTFINQYAESTEESEILFLKGQLSETKVKLEKAEEKLKEYRENNKVFSLSKDILSAISTEAALSANMMLEENKLEMLRSNMTEEHPEIEKIKMNIALMKSKIKNMPQQEVELARLIRNVKIQEIIYENLLKQYESAKIFKTKDNDKFIVLDKAVPPERHHIPNKLKNVIFASAGWFVLFIFIIIFREEYKSI